jgi:ATP-dependent DNA helicase RecG
MTATPIPRTAALTLYGNLSLSLIQQMPQGRKKIKTWLVSEKKRSSAYDWIRNEIKTQKTQAFFICPLIEESEKSMMTEVKSAKQEFKRLQDIYPDLRLGLMHGKLKAKDKNQVMQDFADHQLDILVSTSVIEVGIDVPNATIMIIEGAERFGLAALHQLRGRVGRGDLQSYCLLFSTSGKPQEKSRLKAMENTYSGIELAKLDLKLRGPGEIYGRNQSGFLSLKIASLSDQELVAMTHHYAVQFLPKIQNFPLLQQKLLSDTIPNIKPN